MISLLCPTRNRPTNVNRLIQSALETAADPEYIEFVFYIDEDDTSYDNFENVWNHAAIIFVRGPRIVLSQTWNECYKMATGPYYYHLGDDNIFKTFGWDRYFIHEFSNYPDKILFTHGLDGGPHDATGFGTHGMIHKNWVETVGYFVPPYYVSDFNDTWLNEVANMIGRHTQIRDVMVEHLHPNFGKAELDITHQERLERHHSTNVDALYLSEEHQHLRRLDAEKLQAFIDNYK